MIGVSGEGADLDVEDGSGRRWDMASGTRLRRQLVDVRAVRCRADFSWRRMETGLAYSMGELGSPGVMVRRKSSASSMSRTKVGNVSQQPRWSAISEHPGPRRRWVRMEKRGALSSGTWLVDYAEKNFMS
jgi:hypothetical protein